MEDNTPKSNKKQAGSKTTNEKGVTSQPRPKPIPRQSEISTKVGEHQVVNRILDTSVTLNIREVLASSKELSEQFMEKIKRRNVKPNIVAHAIAL